MKRAFKFFAWLIGSLIVVMAILFFYVRSVAQIDEPRVSGHIDSADVRETNGVRRLGNNWFRKSGSGLFEMYIEGKPYERGVAIGKLSRDLVQYQEEVFNSQIHQLVPSSVYLGALKYFVGWFNRDLDKNVADEFKEEIYGVSRAASHDFDDIAPAYQRMLNYHAAHDIGHALQNMSLVACTAFATWGPASADSSLIVGRNFDFYVGDDFAKNKIVAFYAPTSGYRFMMVTFGGMTGVLSGMNDKGLTVTLNAAKSEIPTGSATPVSLVAREMLQYASTIREAYEIARKRNVFVAEAFMVSSANEGRAAIIERSPDDIDIHESSTNYLIGTNHFQSAKLGGTALNKEHMKNSASVYRYQRVEQLLNRGKNTVRNTASILRNQLGMDDKRVGMGNEKTINQLIAHHAVIFQPAKKLAWVSTSPFQLGEFVCYDLNRIFDRGVDDGEINEVDRTIPADTFLASESFTSAMKFNRYRFPFQSRADLDPDSVVAWNPESYLSYMLAGDFCFDKKDFERAGDFYQKGLEKEIATLQERQHMEKHLQECQKQIRK